VQFDVYRLGPGALALDCQSDLMGDLQTLFTVPLQPLGTTPPPMSRLHPRFEIEGEQVVMATHLAGAIPRSALRNPVGSLALHEYEIKAAIDMLISGY
jgi:toxin CcdB